MQIIQAKTEDYERIRAFYHSLIDAMRGAEYFPGWEKDIYPAPEDLLRAIEKGEFFIGEEESGIAASMVVNESCNEEYANASWPVKRKHGEYLVIHMLGVHPDYVGRGFAKDMVRYAMTLAKERGKAAIRLDVLKGNLPASKLYTGLGFSYIDTIAMFYEDTGWTDYEVYEYAL